MYQGETILFFNYSIQLTCGFDDHKISLLKNYLNYKLMKSFHLFNRLNILEPRSYLISTGVIVGFIIINQFVVWFLRVD